MKIEKVEKLVASLHDKIGYVIHIRNLLQVLSHKLFLRKVYRVIKFNQNASLKPSINMNTDLRKKTKIDFEKDFFKLMNNAVFGKNMENVRKHRDIKLVTTERRRNCLVSKPNYHTTKFFTENLLAIEIKKMRILINKPVYLGFSILELSKILMYEFWHHYAKPKYAEKRCCYVNTDILIGYTKTDDIYKDIAKDVETGLDISN